MLTKEFLKIGEFGAAGMFEEPHRSLFYRKALGIRRFYEHCELPKYEGFPLYPSGKSDSKMRVRPHYINGMDIFSYNLSEVDADLAGKLAADFGNSQSFVPPEHTVAGNMYTHSMPNYPRILKEGLNSYKDRIAKIQDADMREGLMHLVEGINTYVDRCVSYLRSVNADSKLIAALQKVPMNPAENIYEAVLSWNMVMYLDNCDNLGCVADGLLPYYKGEDITELISNLYFNIDAHDGYSMALHANSNPLILQCLEASKGKRRPMIELFVDSDTPDEVWTKAFEVIRTSNAQPAFYNPHVLLDGLTEKFPCISKEDIKKFCGCGCTESSIEGLSAIGSIDAGINMLLILESTIYKYLATTKNFEEFYALYMGDVKAVVDDVTEKISLSQLSRAKYNPIPMRTLLIDDCIDNATELNCGGARYNWSLINFAGLINVIDGLSVIKGMVFDEGTLTADQMIVFLKANDGDFLKKARDYTHSFGNDNPKINEFSNRFTHEVFSMLEGKKPGIGEGFLPCAIQFNNQALAGKHIGATPDGREKGAPLCDSLGAIFGKDTKGPTALLKSVTSLDLKNALGVPVLSFNINPDFKNETLKALILGYFELGGIQMQITCISAETLQKAYENPEMYKNLVVRVGGYSEYFYRLPDDVKRMIINRSIQKKV